MTSSDRKQSASPLGEARERLLARWLRGQAPAPAPSAEIPSAPAGAAPIASYSQERVWFLEQLEPGTSVHNLAFGLWFRGPLDPRLVARCFAEIGRRHHGVRTVFREEAGVPRPELLPASAVELSIVDIGAVSADDLNRLLAEESERSFDVASDVLLRGRLYRVSEVEHTLLIVAHHIVCDGWSMGVFLRELFVLYAAFGAARPSPLPELTIQYADFARWQRERSEGEVGAAHVAYWRERLRGPLQVLELPILPVPRAVAVGARSAPAAETLRGTLQSFALPATALAELKAFCAREETTAFTVLLGIFHVLLRRYCGERDMLVGLPVANRTTTEMEALAGLFTNVVVLRTSLDDDLTFRGLLGRLRGTLAEAYEHQELPFERLLEELRPERSLAHSPLFQVMFVYRNSPIPELVLNGISVERRPVHNGASRFPLTMIIESEGGRLSPYFEYRTDLFDPGTITRMGLHFGALLADALTRPEAPISGLALLTDEERSAALAAADGPALEGAPVRVHDAIAARAVIAPDAVAVRSLGRSLGYAELDRRAEALAAALVLRGVGPGTIVPLCVGRSPELVVGILGILKAGAAYAPLEPGYPPERLRGVVADSGARVAVTTRDYADKVGDVERVLLDDMPADDVGAAAPPRAGGESPAYVIYTSGSTNAPKGVVVTQDNLAFSTQARLACYGDAPPTFLLLSSFAFDSSVAGIFGTLCAGGTLVIPDESRQGDLIHLAELVAVERVTHLLAVPSLYRLLVERAELRALRVAIVAGEVCPPELVARHFDHMPDTELWNEYGPTEGTVWCTVHRCSPADAADERVSIGRPSPGARVYVLDDRRELVPPGTPGELYVGGRGVAAGYHELPELTRGRFVPDPWTGGRMFRTGDRARASADGKIEYLGRLDRQVKIRGYRVEPEEVETALVRYVREAAVIATPVHGEQGATLVAYVVREPDGASDLAAALGSALPAYLVPSIFVDLAAMPRTDTGKIDYARLPPPPRIESRAVYREPEREIEWKLAEIWRAALGVERVGLDDNFFDLGGHSLLVMKVHAKVSEAVGRSVPVVLLFQNPTVRSLAAHLGGAPAPADDDDAATTAGAGRARLAERRARLRRSEPDQ